MPPNYKLIKNVPTEPSSESHGQLAFVLEHLIQTGSLFTIDGAEKYKDVFLRNQEPAFVELLGTGAFKTLSPQAPRLLSNISLPSFHLSI